MLWDLLQQRQISEASQNSDLALSKASRVVQDTGKNTRDIDQLTLACQAMWELIREKMGFTDEQLRQKISEIDLRDGLKDVKIGMEMIICPSCARDTNTIHSACTYCGCEILGSHAMK